MHRLPLIRTSEKVGDCSGARLRSDDDDDVATEELKIGSRAGDDLSAADNGDYRSTRARSRLGVAQGPAVVRSTGQDGDLPADQTIDLTIEVVQPLHDPGSAEQLRQRVALFLLEDDCLAAGVRILRIVNHQLPQA